MPARAMTKAATPPASSQEDLEKPASNERKRSAPVGSDDESNAPAPKRAKAPVEQSASQPPTRISSRVAANKAIEDKKAAEAAKKAAASKKAKTTKATVAPKPKKETVPRVPKPLPPFLNPLPVPADHPRPARQLFIWGNSDMGQLGFGPDVTGDYPKPKLQTWFDKAVKEGTLGGEGAGIEQVACGGLHTLVIDESGKIWSWGVNDDAALGRITDHVPSPSDPTKFLDPDDLQCSPHVLQSLVDENFRAVLIAAGDSISAAVNDQGELKIWGSFRANEGNLGFRQTSETVSHSRHTEVVETTIRKQFLPMALPFFNSPKLKLSQLAVGTNHIMALTVYGEVYIWGAGEQGQLGRKILDRRKGHGLQPEKVALKNACLIGAGSYHSFAVDTDGDVFGWGLNSLGQVGVSRGTKIKIDVVETPTMIHELCSSNLGNGAKIVQISGGEHHTLFLASDGRVFACGRRSGGQLGLPDGHAAFRNAEDYIHTPTIIAFTQPIAHIATGTHNNLALSTTGQLYSWGEGQLGLGADIEEQKIPTLVGGKADGKWVGAGASLGGQHSVGVFTRKPDAD